MRTSKAIKERIEKAGKRYHACDNIAEFIEDGEHQLLIDELTESFTKVLKDLVIDIDTDPNSKGTARRLAKMYVKEIMYGRYYPSPEVTAFPNGEFKEFPFTIDGQEAVDRIFNQDYDGMLVVRAEIKSVCSHHHKDVNGTAYIGVMPKQKVIGLSKYIRIAQWHARRGTLQEELTKRLALAISEETESPDVGVYIQATHGCVSCRGVGQENSLTQTAVLLGRFREDKSIKKEFMDYINLQEARSNA